MITSKDLCRMLGASRRGKRELLPWRFLLSLRITLSRSRATPQHRKVVNSRIVAYFQNRLCPSTPSRTRPPAADATRDRPRFRVAGADRSRKESLLRVLDHSSACREQEKTQAHRGTRSRRGPASRKKFVIASQRCWPTGVLTHVFIRSCKQLGSGGLAGLHAVKDLSKRPIVEISPQKRKRAGLIQAHSVRKKQEGLNF